MVLDRKPSSPQQPFSESEGKKANCASAVLHSQLAQERRVLYDSSRVKSERVIRAQCCTLYYPSTVHRQSIIYDETRVSASLSLSLSFPVCNSRHRVTSERASSDRIYRPRTPKERNQSKESEADNKKRRFIHTHTHVDVVL